MGEIIKSNLDDIYLRNLVVAVIEWFGSQMKGKQVIDGVEHEYPMYVYFRKDDDQQFMRDFFIHYKNKCRHETTHAQGDFDVYPNMQINMPKVSVLVSDMTNPYVRGNYMKVEQDGNGYEIERPYSAVLNSIPLRVSMEAEIHTDTVEQTYKAWQEIMDMMFKNHKLYFNYRGQRMQINVTVGDEYTHDKKQDYKFETDDVHKQELKFGLQIEAYYPQFDKETEKFDGALFQTIRLLFREAEIGMKQNLEAALTEDGVKYDA